MKLFWRILLVLLIIGIVLSMLLAPLIPSGKPGIIFYEVYRYINGG